ncbi:MAG: response regulator transcription factor [Lachnospiraceae bacterium]|nr:response regulator transcription factor [Lachnospiraceae bacterium]
MNHKYKVLIIEDEANIRNFVKTILETNGYRVLEAANSSEGRMLFSSHLPDIIILDLGLPDGDGMDIIKMVREECAIPIIVLSARTDETDKVEALDHGANDYVTKPFGTAELLARLRAALRIYQRYHGQKKSNPKYCVKDLEIDFETRRIYLKGKEIKLTQTEYKIVALLAANSDRVMTYAEIIKEIWVWQDSGSVKKLQVNMANIRKKMGIKPGENQYIQNELGVGYRMNTEL